MDTDFTVEEHNRIISLCGNFDFANSPRFLVDGSPFHTHTTASEKVIIAHYDENQIQIVVNQWGVSSVTPYTITAEDELYAELIVSAGRGMPRWQRRLRDSGWSVRR